LVFIMLHLVLFLIFGGLCLAGAINLLAQKHPIASALSLIVVMGSLAVLYMLLGAEFVAAIQVIIYAGAVMVLFVFVIMLLNAGVEERTGTSYVAWYVGIPGLLTLAALVVYALLQPGSKPQPQLSMEGASSGEAFGAVGPIAHLLFRDYLLPFEVTSVLILIAIMGAVVLARRGED
jgi:NADH-quinone oxidoreductase subunit J